MLFFAATSTTTGSHLDRKALKRPDEFTTSVKSFFDQIADHSTAFLAVLAVLFAIGLAIAFVANRRDQRQEEAREALFRAQQVAAKEQQALAPAPQGKDAKPAAPSASLYAPVDVDAKLPESVRSLKGVVSAHSGTLAGYQAALELGNLYYDHGQPEKSLPWFEDALREAKTDADRAFALYAAGYARENMKAYKDAIDSYEKAMNYGQLGLKGDLLLAIARNEKLLGDNAKARASYDRVISELPESEYAKTAEVLKGELPK